MTGQALPWSPLAGDWFRKARWGMQRLENGVGAGEIEGVQWRKSRRSGGNGNCVEIAALSGGGVAMRNSRFPSGPALIYTREEIEAFFGGVKDGEFDFALK
ncbi:uncharacterized protein DUF397 [Streptomyces sp. TLI_185]|nr:uncharacterized protein DUF397 [Streptomyces sp. TLI_185]